MIRFEKVLLKQSSDPNLVGNAGAHLGSAILRTDGQSPHSSAERIELSPDGNWLIVNSKRWIPRELVLHADAEPPPAAIELEPEELEDGRVVCPTCGDVFKNAKALGGHKPHCRKESA
jgi:hypothetical protein